MMKNSNYTQFENTGVPLAVSLLTKCKGCIKTAFAASGLTVKLTAGSVVDVNGDLIHFDSDSSVITISATGINYIGLSPSTRDILIAGTPAFDEAKLGYYDASGNRAVLVVLYNGSILNIFRMKK